jgi:carbamoyl-phosphate synthase small subunit
VDEATLPDNLQPTHRSLFDGTLQGVTRTDRPAFSFQGHPEASPGPHDLQLLFEHFMYLMVKRIQTHSRQRSLKQKSAGV